MSTTVRGFTVRDLTQHGKAEIGQVVVNPGKVLPATATGNLFAVTGIVVVNALFGFVSTILSVTAVNIKLGVTNLPAVIAANPASPYASTAVGSVVVPPPTLGGALPAAVVAQAAVSASCNIVVNGNTAPNITITTDATNTGAITWVLSYNKLYPKGAGAVTAV